MQKRNEKGLFVDMGRSRDRGVFFRLPIARYEQLQAIARTKSLPIAAVARSYVLEALKREGKSDGDSQGV